MFALPGHTILDTLEGYRSSGVHKERSKFFFRRNYPQPGFIFLPSFTIFFLFFFYFFTFCWGRTRTQLCGSHLSEDGWMDRETRIRPVWNLKTKDMGWAYGLIGNTTQGFRILDIGY